MRAAICIAHSNLLAKEIPGLKCCALLYKPTISENWNMEKQGSDITIYKLVHLENYKDK